MKIFSNWVLRLFMHMWILSNPTYQDLCWEEPIHAIGPDLDLWIVSENPFLL